MPGKANYAPRKTIIENPATNRQHRPDQPPLTQQRMDRDGDGDQRRRRQGQDIGLCDQNASTGNAIRLSAPASTFLRSVDAATSSRWAK